MRPALGSKLKPFGTTIFSEMTRLAQEHGAVNLSQGFPDFEGPPALIDAAVKALRAQDNQYARSQGHPDLVRAVASRRKQDTGLDYDPMSEVGVFAGATEGIAASLMGMLDPGDEVILFEPFYDSYPAICALAGAHPKYLTLRAPDFRIRREELEPLFGPKTRLLLLNTPHNPTGRVFDDAELDLVASLCLEHGVRVITDEVYEQIVYAPAKHRAFASLPGMRARTLSLSSLGKTFSFTGWKIGWATGPEDMIAAAQAAHQFLTFAVATPLQRAAAFALNELGAEFITQLQREYRERRSFLLEALERAGLKPLPPQGAYFVLADFSDLYDGDDRGFVKHLIEEIGVAAIPPSVFYASDPQAGRKLVRFAFCKRRKTLEEAARRLEKLKR